MARGPAVRSRLNGLRSRVSTVLPLVHAAPSSRKLLVSSGVLALSVAITAGVALGTTGHDTKRASDDEPAAKTTSSALLPVGTLIAQGKLPKPTLRGDEGDVGVPADTPPRPTTPVDLAAGSTAARYSGRAGTLTPVGIATLAMQRGCRADQAVIATAVAMAESGGSPSAQGDVTLMDATWDWSAGLWQIRGLKTQRNTGALRDSVANQNAVTNSAAMYTISNGCTNWVPWSTYNNGAYRGYLTVATQAVQYVLAYYKAHGRYPAVAPPDPNATVPVPNGNVAAADPAAAASSNAAARHPGAAHPTAKAGGHSTAAAGGSNGGTGGGSGNGGGAPATRTAAAGGGQPAPASTRAAAKVTKPVEKVTSAVGGVVSTVTSILKPPCIPTPLTHC